VDIILQKTGTAMIQDLLAAASKFKLKLVLEFSYFREDWLKDVTKVR
jgi:hypothetical protein